MATYREMQDRINLDYLNRTDLTSETRRAIIRAIKQYEKKKFWFNQTATALAVGTASTTFAIPADFLSLEFATVRDSSIDSQVVIRSFDRVQYKASNLSGSGVPSEIAYFKDAFYIDTKPRSATNITIYYTHSLPALSADADTNAWTSAAEDLIVHRATADMLANVLRVTDAKQVEAHKLWETEALAQLEAGNKLRMGAGADTAVMGSIHSQKPKAPDGAGT